MPSSSADALRVGAPAKSMAATEAELVISPSVRETYETMVALTVRVAVTEQAADRAGGRNRRYKIVERPDCSHDGRVLSTAPA